jgi:transcription elongation factor GreA
MKKLITESGLEIITNRLQEKLSLLKKIREEKAHAYTASGDGWHDNPGWIQIGQQEDLLVSEINDLQKCISTAVILKPTTDFTKVKIGCNVEFEMRNRKTGAIRQQKVAIGGTGESDLKNNKISYDSPIGNALLEMEAGEAKEVHLPAGIIEIRIINILY